MNSKPFPRTIALLVIFAFRAAADSPALVSITSPTNNEAFIPGANVAVNVSLSDPVDDVSQVDLYVNGQLQGSRAAFPYAFSLGNVGLGSHTLSAVAVVNGGLSVTSAPVLISVPFEADAVTLVANRSCWRYNDQGLDLGADWSRPGYDDSTWSQGFAELGYGNSDQATVIGFGPDPDNKYVTTYFRRTFSVPDPGSISNLLLRLKRNHGAVVYLNGTEVFRDNLHSGLVSFNTLAINAADEEASYVVSNVSPYVLVSDENVVAVEIHQAVTNSTNTSFDLQLIGQWGVALPRLTVARADSTALVLSWPEATRPEFVLQSSSALGPLANWTTVPASEVLDASWRYVTNALESAAKFYQLRATTLDISTCQPPVVVSQPLKVAVPPGDSVDLAVVAAGSPSFGYSWRKNQRSANNTNATLTLTNLQRNSGGAYDVLLGNTCACVLSCPIVLVVGGTNVSLADSFAARTTFAAAAAQLNASNALATTEAGEPVNPARTFGRTLWLQWIAPASGIAVFDTEGSGLATALAVYTGNTLSSLARETYAGPSDPSSHSRLVFNAVGGTAYQVQLDGAGPTPSLCVNWDLTVTTNAAAQITQQPQSNYVPFGTIATFTVEATLPPPLMSSLITYQWFKEEVSIPGATSPTLTLPDITNSDIAQYFAVASFNSLVSTSDVVSLSGLKSLGAVGSGSISPPLSSFGGELPCGATKFDGHLIYYFRTRNSLQQCQLPCLSGNIYTVPVFQPAATSSSGCQPLPVAPGLGCASPVPAGALATAKFDTFGSTDSSGGSPDTALVVGKFKNCYACATTYCTNDIPPSLLSSFQTTITSNCSDLSDSFIKIAILYKKPAATATITLILNYQYCP